MDLTTKMDAEAWLSWLCTIGAPDAAELAAADRELTGAARRAS